MKTTCTSEAPKLPRFKAPKSMKSVVFKTNKDKASTRQKLNLKAKRLVDEDE